MFKNVGEKIRLVAMISCWVGIAGSAIGGIVLMADGDEEMILIGLLVLLAGSFFSWISSLFLYGFGELVQNSTDILARTKGQKRPGTAYQAQQPMQNYGAPQQQFSAPQQPYSAPQQPYSAPQQPYSAPQHPYDAPQQNTFGNTNKII